MPARRVFTPATIQIVRDLANQGLSAAEIADVIGSTAASVRVKCSQRNIRLGRRGRPSAPDYAGKVKLLIYIDPDDLAALRRKAAQMNQTPVHLAAMLLQAIVASDIYEAVLGEQ
jgi:hypothetical protein